MLRVLLALRLPSLHQVREVAVKPSDEFQAALRARLLADHLAQREALLNIADAIGTHRLAIDIFPDDRSLRDSSTFAISILRRAHQAELFDPTPAGLER